MNTKHVIVKILAVWWTFIVVFSLVNCGGGGKGEDSLLRTGYFSDSPVEGLKYKTETHSGLTGSDGAFQYSSGEDVSFYVGDILIGRTRGAESLSPFELAGLTRSVTGAETRLAKEQTTRTRSITPFSVSVNIAVFLQTLDEDGDIENGIRIPETVHTLATGFSIDFKQFYLDFINDYTFRKFMTVCRGTGLWGGSRAIRNPAYALSSLYAGAGLAPQIYALSLVEYSNNVNGTIDFQETFTYDEKGDRTQAELFDIAQGFVSVRTNYAYDSGGNLTSAESCYYSAVDTLYRIYKDTYTYDANGNMTMNEDSPYGISTYTYDEYGNRTMGSGPFGKYLTYYNTDGKPSFTESDFDAAGNPRRRTFFTYDGNGKLILEEQDYDGDGVADYRVTYAYDSKGELFEKRIEFSGNGITDRIVTFTYDRNGNQTLEESYSNTENTPQYRYTYTYDSDGDLIKEEYDDGVDGSIERRVLYTYDMIPARAE